MFNLKDIKRKSHNLSPLIRIGKNGLTDSLIKEIKFNLKKKKILKIKYNKAVMDVADRKELTTEIVSKTDSILVSAVGNTIVLLYNGENGTIN